MSEHPIHGPVTISVTDDTRRLGEALEQIAGLTEALKESWKIASRFSVRPNARCHPDISYSQMNETAKVVMHTTAQQISWEIKDMVDEALARYGVRP